MFFWSKYLVAAVYSTSVFLSSTFVQAAPAQQSQYTVGAYDLANAVNALRAAYGLAPYSINSILMSTAQNQADFMAATGQVTHTGPGGSTLTQRLLAAGYPLDGDLSLGGFRAENITSGNESTTAEAVVNAWMGDALHQNTMLSAALTEIGAGVAVANGRVYFVIDAARPTNAPAIPSAGTSVVESGATVPGGEVPISPVRLSTPDSQGEVIHQVQYGQTLWQLAIAYGVKIDDIRRLNDLFDNNIYPGTTLLIKVGVAATPALPTAIVVPSLAAAPSETVTALPTAAATFTPMPAAPGNESSNNVMTWAVGIIAFALLGALVVAWHGARSNAAKNG